MVVKSIRAGCRRLLALPLAILSLLSWLLPRRGVPVNQSSSIRTSPLGYLDPLRGFFCLQVLIQHSNSDYYWWVPGWVIKNPYTHFFLRSGTLSLQGFFWLSGYVMTYKLVKLAQTKQWEAFLSSASSSLFRRYLRLHLPILPVTFVTLLMIKFGLIVLPAHHNIGIDLQKEYFIVGWLRDSMHFLNPFLHIVGAFDGKIGSAIVKPSWSLPAEFRASVTVLAYLVATCKVPSYRRKILTFALLPLFMYWKSTFTTMAFFGFFCAELRQSRSGSQPVSLPAPAASKLSPVQVKEITVETKLMDNDEWVSKPQRRIPLPDWRTIGLLMMFTYSFVLLRDARQKEGKTLLMRLVLPYITDPGEKMWWIMGGEGTLGALMLLLSLDQVAILQRPLRTSFAQYLGELSFGIYCTHMTVVHSLWGPVYLKWQQKGFGTADGQRAVDNFWVMSIGHLLLIMIVLWTAELFRRMDVQIARFVEWTKTSMFAKD